MAVSKTIVLLFAVLAVASAAEEGEKAKRDYILGSPYGMTYGAPAMTYAAPAMTYAAPAMSYAAPTMAYSAPAYAAPAYTAPAMTYSSYYGNMYNTHPMGYY